MTSNREERFLMRQRGAGTRQIKDFSFDIALPGASRSPLKPVASRRSRRTQPKLLPQRSSRRTSKPTPLQPVRSSRRTPQPKPTQLRRSSRRTPATLQSQVLNAPHNTDAQQQDQSALQHSRSDGLGSPTKKRKASVEPLNSDLQRSGSFLEGGPVGASTIVIDQVPSQEERNSPFDSHATEGMAARDEPPKKKRKKRKSIVQIPKKKIRQPPLDPIPLQGLADIHAVQPLADTNKPVKEEIDEPPIHYVVPENIEIPDLLKGPLRKPKKKKRKSIAMPKSCKKSTLAPLIASPILEKDSNPVADRVKATVGGPDPSDERREQSAENMLASIREEVEELESDVEKSKDQKKHASLDTMGNFVRPRGSSLVPQGKGGNRAIKRGPSRKTKAGISDQESGSLSSMKVGKRSQQQQVSKHTNGSIPITAYRLSKVSGDCEEDELIGPGEFPTKRGVNAVDVLGQICRETIAKFVDTMDETNNNTQNSRSRAEWKRRRKTIEIFKDELDSEIFQMSEAVDNNHALKSRVRKVKKEVNAAREELLNIRREREQIALQMDDVRIKHEMVSRSSEKTNDLNNLLQDIELAVQRGRAQQTKEKEDIINQEKSLARLNFTLPYVAGKVSSVQGPGLLERVKSFNSLLERTITSL